MNPRRIAHLLRERARIDEALAAEYERDDTEIDGEYSSTSLPPGITSREHFATECRRLGVGTKHGRIWTVTAREWLQARNAKKRHLRAVPAPESAVTMADADIDAAGARATRRR
ncbi:MAG TPA: hypothetical protein VGH28_14130 [Polyangiaceae bacterium]|jgi:hypothetical protein